MKQQEKDRGEDGMSEEGEETRGKWWRRKLRENIKEK